MSDINAIGLMSGTSVDSIDAAVVSFGEENGGVIIKKITGISYPLPEQVRELIFDLFEDSAGSLKKQILVNALFGEILAEAVLKLMKHAALRAEDVTVIGSHGQTVYHIAEKADCCGHMVRGSLQIGEGAVIAQRTGIPVISDFRSGDVAAGGSGAPLVPFLDLLLADRFGEKVAFQNIGGIGNVTFIAGSDTPPVAFDTGPGNMIVDRLVSEYTRGELTYDRDGEIGRRGRPDEDLLRNWLKHPYFSKRPPKSTGREEFGTAFYTSYLSGIPIDADLIRTAEEFTARSIAQAYMDHLEKLPSVMVITGGGGHNPVIVGSIKDQLSGCRVYTGDEAGISTDFKEAAAFALMGYYAFTGRTNNVPSATGALREAVMGKLSLP